MTFHLNPNLENNLHTMPELKDLAMETAQQIAEAAAATAPVESGDYAASIHAEKTKNAARVFASDYKSAWIEFGVPSQGQPARWVLRNAVKSLGLKFKKGR